jgi:E3 ubiquitin-protein ligase SIAH1
VPLHTLKYGKVSRLQVPASVPRLLLVAEDDGRVFLLTMGALGGARTTAVSAVCVRASAAARPRFTCKMWVNLQQPAAENGSGKSDVVLVEMTVRSSTSPGAVVAADQPTFLSVPPMYLVPGQGDDGPSREVPLSIRIDKVSPWSC